MFAPLCFSSSPTQTGVLHGGPIAGDLMGWGGMDGWPDLEPGIPRLVLRTACPTLIQFTGTRIQGTIQTGSAPACACGLLFVSKGLFFVCVCVVRLRGDKKGPEKNLGPGSRPGALPACYVICGRIITLSRPQSAREKKAHSLRPDNPRDPVGSR